MKKKLNKNQDPDLLLTDEEFYKKYKMTPEEIELEKEIERGEWKSVPNLEAEKKRMAEYAKYTRLKNKNINIRINDEDLSKLKSRAEKAGIPYQTIITSMVHQYVNNKITIHL